MKIGEIYTVKKGSEAKCKSFLTSNGAFIRITVLSGKKDILYEILNERKEPIDWCYSCFEEEDLEPLEKTLYTLEVGDIILDRFGNEIKIIEVFNHGYATRILNCFDDYALEMKSSKDLEKFGYTIKGAITKEEPKKMTLEKIEKELGYKISLIK